MTVGKRYVTDVRVRWSDLDAFGHVNNARTVTLLEEARVAWLFVEAARHGAGRLTEGVVVATLDIAYRRQIGFGLPVTVSMGLTALAAASFTIDYRVTVGGDLVVTAGTQLVPVDPATFRPRRLDPAERDFLQPYLVSS
jgi:acyl-CoA thioester hydrolase